VIYNSLASQLTLRLQFLKFIFFRLVPSVQYLPTVRSRHAMKRHQVRY